MNFTKIVKADLDSPRRELSHGGLGIVLSNPSGSSVNYFFVCVYWGSNPAVSTEVITDYGDRQLQSPATCVLPIWPGPCGSASVCVHVNREFAGVRFNIPAPVYWCRGVGGDLPSLFVLEMGGRFWLGGGKSGTNAYVAYRRSKFCRLIYFSLNMCSRALLVSSC